MALRDEVKEQRKKLKGQPLKKKLEYYFDYYKWCLAVILLIVIGLSIFYDQYKDAHRPKALYGLVMNLDIFINLDDLTDSFADKYDINTDKTPVLLDPTISYQVNKDGGISYSDIYTPVFIQQLMTEESLDFFTIDVTTLDYFSNGKFLTDLSEFLEEEVYEDFKDYMHYVTFEDKETGTTKTIPAGISLKDTSYFNTNGAPELTEYIFCVCPNAPHYETIVNFLYHLFDGVVTR